MRISIDFYIATYGITKKKSEMFIVSDDFNGKEDAIKIANLFIKQLQRGLEKNEKIERVVFNEDDITPFVFTHILKLVK
ncbi:hypothetical protein KHA93_11550 [Bacillus sp. FJAT-49732]|uniref:Uncharacterized protein n=1 Tax=Lederbergia citrisecunda TaxID=2833583 RepID=A0A942TLD3_9BACI|nr:hypothetical protein [Lederbergia citrisecunda]MBS4200265.1 hypothetical protein [Lederbergia citrisecunda]